jgi:hypothetical protein
MTRRYNRGRRSTPRTEEKSLLPTDTALSATGERRRLERRTRTFTALVRGSFTPRRRVPRRGNEASFASVDWHHPQWLAVALLILLLCCADAILTITLLERGAYELNPLMAHLVERSGLAFAVVKLGLTSSGVVMLTLIAGTRVFGRLPVGLVLYSVLAGYVLLIAYELYLLEHVPPVVVPMF